jgi:hypothetical protein
MFCQPNEQTLQMKEKVFSLTGDDFTVTTVAGVHVCKCKGKVLSISGAKSMLPFPPIVQSSHYQRPKLTDF